MADAIGSLFALIQGDKGKIWAESLKGWDKGTDGKLELRDDTRGIVSAYYSGQTVIFPTAINSFWITLLFLTL